MYRGGLGHFTVMFAKAVGAEVYGISHSPSKKDDALKIGTKYFNINNKDN
jgi:alcohol dehydrogenase (NADP+)